MAIIRAVCVSEITLDETLLISVGKLDWVAAAATARNKMAKKRQN